MARKFNERDIVFVPQHNYTDIVWFVEFDGDIWFEKDIPDVDFGNCFKQSEVVAATDEQKEAFFERVNRYISVDVVTDVGQRYDVIYFKNNKQISIVKVDADGNSDLFATVYPEVDIKDKDTLKYFGAGYIQCASVYKPAVIDIDIERDYNIWLE